METKFNFKSTICTSREQSKALLKLGLKKETADMFYSTILENDDIARVCYEDFWNSNKAIDSYIRRRCIPAWSLGRLLEVMRMKASSQIVPLDDTFDRLIEGIETRVKEGYFNKEYLEER